MTKAVIGILGALGSVQSAGTNVPIAYVNDAYCQAIIRAGGIPLILPVTSDSEKAAQMFALCDGFLFPGGEDVDPRFYNEAPHPLLGTINQLSDSFWLSAFSYSQQYNKPVLGICRGMQLINIAMGGSLYQDLSARPQPSHLHLQKQGRDYLMHQVSITSNSNLYKILSVESIYTNTMHHQCVKTLGKGLKICAQTADDLPEALENNDGSIILVQWHPEELLTSEPRMQKLFENLIQRTQN